MGAVLIVMAVGVLVIDQRMGPWYPFLFLFVSSLALTAGWELLHLMEAGLKSQGDALAEARPRAWLSLGSLLSLVVMNWVPHVLGVNPPWNAWLWLAVAFAVVVLMIFLVEMITFQRPGVSVLRMALQCWFVGYLGLLSCFVVQLRWLPDLPDQDRIGRGGAALALTLFVPKFGDIGAFFVGKSLGRHRMTPVLSPNKTWEGAAGAVLVSVAAALVIETAFPVLNGGKLAAVGYGVTVGVAGLVGDLAESLIKRDCRQKDASQAIPGFGGVLDVVDSVVFSAPIAYAWLVW